MENLLGLFVWNAIERPVQFLHIWQFYAIVICTSVAGGLIGVAVNGLFLRWDRRRWRTMGTCDSCNQPCLWMDEKRQRIWTTNQQGEPVPLDKNLRAALEQPAEETTAQQA